MDEIGTQQQLAKLDLQNIEFELGESVVKVTDTVKNLGVILDQNFNFRSQVSAVSKGAYFQLYNIQKARGSLDEEAAKLAINSFVHSKLDYGNALLYGLPNQVTYSLQKVQNSAARTLTGVNRREHITPVLKDLHWLKMDRRREYKILTYMFKIHIGAAPEYLRELVTKYEPGRCLRSANQNRYTEISTSLKTGGDRAFAKVGPVLWNRLPSELRSMSSLSSFKRALKTYLFRVEYGC